MDEKIKALFLRLSKSKFRSSFHLKEKDKKYIIDKGLDVIEKHAYEFISKRISLKPVDLVYNSMYNKSIRKEAKSNGKTSQAICSHLH